MEESTSESLSRSLLLNCKNTNYFIPEKGPLSCRRLTRENFLPLQTAMADKKTSRLMAKNAVLRCPL